MHRIMTMSQTKTHQGAFCTVAPFVLRVLTELFDTYRCSQSQDLRLGLDLVQKT